MGHVVLTTATGRIELNLNADQEAGLARALVAMIAAEPARLPRDSAGRDELRTAPAAAPGGDDSPGAGEPQAMVHGSRTTSREPAKARLLPRTCAAEGCDTVFQPYRPNALYCSEGCSRAVHTATAAARTAERNAGPERCPDCPRSFVSPHALRVHRARTHGFRSPLPPTEHRCTEPGCGATFSTGKALGGHKATHRTKGKAQPARRLPVSPHAVSVGKAEVGPPSDIPRNIIGAKITPREDRPFACKEPGCGHPCRSLAELHKHRLAYHDEKHPLPKVTQVIAALSFTCPEDGCGRVYDDENRLTHHRRVIHDYQRPDVIHEVVVNTAAKAVKVG